MTDTELNELEALARAATPGPWDKESSFWNSSFSRCTEYPPFTVKAKGFDVAFCYGKHCTEDAAYIAAANPAVVLKLIAELRQAKAERDWIIEQIENGWPCPPTSDEFVGDCDKEMSCKDCWIKAAKEATK